MVIFMVDYSFEIRLISKEILKKYDCYDYKFVYKVALELFNYGIRYYMFLDDDSAEIGIWEIVEYVLSNFNVVDINNFLSCVVNGNVYFNDVVYNNVNNISDMKFCKKLKSGNRNSKFKN